MLSLFVSVPIASFRTPQAREYFETLPCPPPSTIYGMLLALVGESNRLRHLGTEIAAALVSTPQHSVVLRTLWRVKSKKTGPGIGENKRPDFQELLTGIRLAVWVRAGTAEVANPSLSERLRQVATVPATAKRFGGLSLGESTHLVDEVRLLRPGDGHEGQFLVRDPRGNLALPVWADHVGSAGTVWEQYRLVAFPLTGEVPADAWTAIRRGEEIT
jgi:CRISPR-associated protein Cas5t